MGLNVFISYSHKDEAYKDAFIEHLSSLERSGTINHWNDRMIPAGTEWNEQISTHLESSQLILFLISSSFLNSRYCVDVEVRKALEMHKEGRAILIPILIRAVDWGTSELSQIQGLPKDAKPVKSWIDQDEAWVNVIDGIKSQIEIFKPKEKVVSQEVEYSKVSISEKTQVWLDDTEIVLTHRTVDKIKLFDIYTVPDLKVDSDEDLELRIFKNAENILTAYSKLIIYGEEQQGKTSLLKYFYREFLKQGKLPLVLEGQKIKTATLKLAIEKALAEQYRDIEYSDYCDSKKKILLIDNIDEIPLNKKYRDKLLSEVNDVFTDCVVYTCQVPFSFVTNEITALNDYARTELLGFGNKKREEIIQKWICLGVEQTISDEELYVQCDELKDRLNSIVKKNILPPKPIYILMLLQMFEAHVKLNLELSSHGHCYQQLIYQSFKNAKIKDLEFDKYLNVLTELSWWILTNGINPNAHQLEHFFRSYGENYLLADPETILTKLIGNSILSQKDFRTGFKYPYIFYFFVGKKIAESYTESEECRDKVKNLMENLHREDYANILIFVTHHTKESWVLENISAMLLNLFEDQNAATLDKQQLAFMDEFMRQIPELIIEQRGVQEERDKHNEELDRVERSDYEEDEIESLDILANINKTFKCVEIAGQIIKNRHASLKRGALLDLANNGIMSSLRLLNYFISITDVAKNGIIKVIATHLSENPSLTNMEVEKHAESAYLHLTYGVINGFIRKTAASMGSKDAMEIYQLIEVKQSSPALLLIKQSIDLQFNKKADIKGITDCAEKLKDNFVCSRILKELMIQHIYMFPVDYKEKQQISHLLGIPLKGQQLMEKKQKQIGA